MSVLAAQPAGPFPKPRFVPAPKPAATSASQPAEAEDSELEQIAVSSEQDPSGCVRRATDLWKRRDGRAPRAILLAAEKASGNQAPEIIAAVDELLSRKGAEVPRSAFAFFDEPAKRLSQKMSNKEPLLDLALKHGCWEMIPRYEVDAAAKERYLLRGLRKAEKLHCDSAFYSLALFVREDSVGEVRSIMRSLKDTPSWAGFRIALRTLVDLEDASIIPDLESLVARTDLAPEQKAEAEVYLSKLKWQHSPDKLLQIAQTERTNRRLLSWAVRRLLLLNTSRSTIYSALGMNRQQDQDARRDAAALVETALRAADSENPPLKARIDFDPLIFDRSQLREYDRALRNARDAVEAQAIMSRYSEI
jgi:hypothetical protein